MRVCGQEFSFDILERIGQAVAADPGISRRALSRQVCQWLGWRSDSGRWQEGGCRKALAELVRRQALVLPPVSHGVPARRAPRVQVEERQVCSELAGLGPSR